MNENEPDDHGWKRRLLDSCRRHRGLTALVIITAMLATGLAAVPPLVMRLGLNDAVAGRTDRLTLYLVGLGASALVVFVGAFARQFLTAKLALSVQHDLRTDVFSSLQRLDGAKQDSLRTGQVMSRVNIDLQMVQGFLSQAPTAVGSVVLIVVSFAAMLWLSPLLTLVQLAMVAGFGVITVLSSRRLEPATWAVQHRNAVLAQIVTETVAGAYVVKGFAQERREVDHFTAQSKQLFAERMRVARLQSQPMASLQSLPLLAQVGILVLGGYLAITNRISIGDFVAFAAFTTTLTAPAGVLSNLIIAAQLTAPSATRVYELLDTHSDVVDPPNAVDVPAGRLGVSFDHLSFGYVPGEPVLDDLSLVIEPGETVAVVGPSGSGKSTLALLLPRFYDPQHGAVRLQTPEGDLDITGASLRSLRSRVGVVFEEPFLFAGTISRNIAYGHPNASIDQIRAAARSAGATGFIDELPGGYDSEVGEKGANLSGGQRQRLALARTLLAGPGLLVLDDATSAVDAATAAEIGEALAEVAADHTTILIAQRRASLALAGRVVVMEDGRVVDTGTVAELDERCELFRELFGGHDRVAAAEIDRSALWPEELELQDATGESEAADGASPDDEVMLDGMAVERTRADAVDALPSATGAPAAQLGEDPPAGTPPIKGLFSILRPVRALVLAAILLMAVDAAVTSVIPALIQRGMDGGVANRDMSALWMVAGIAVLFVAVNWVVLYWQPRLIARTGESAMFAMRVRSFRHLHKLGMQHFERERGGGLLTRMTTDIASLADFVEAGLTVAVVNVLTLGVMATAMVVIDPGLALAGFAVLPFLVLATFIFRKLSGSAYQESRERIGAVNEDLQENLEGLRTNQSHGQTDDAQERFGGLSEGLRRIRLKAQSYAAAYFPFVALLSEVSIIIVLLVGVPRIANGQLSPGVLTAFLLYLGLFFAPFQQLSMIFDGYQRASVGAERIADLLTIQPAIKDKAALGAGVGSGLDVEPAASNRPTGAVIIDSVDFSYPDSAEPALRQVSISVPAGSTVALVGETGSGKSTLVKLVARLYEIDAGTISVDGRSIGDWPVEELRRRFGVVPQEPHLFAGSVADNIAYARPDAERDAIESAADAVGATRMIARLPNGFRQEIGEHTSGLSTGQAQLVALARARLADPDILLLDEPTGSLDAVTEREVLAAMNEVAARRTTFLVTHRLASAAQADQVVVLDHGRVIEQGTHDELLKRRGRYAKLWALDQADQSASGDDHDGVDHENNDHQPGVVRRFAFVTAALVWMGALARRIMIVGASRRPRRR